MVARKTLFIWDGPNSVTITKGEQLVRNQDCPWMYNTKVKQKGLFTPYITIMNIDEMFIGNAKTLMVGDRPQGGWEVIRIRKDFLTHDSNIPDIPPSVIAQIKSLRNEVEIWKRQYFEAKRLNEDREQKDRFRGRVSEEFDFVAKQRNKFFGQNDMFGGGFLPRWGISQPPMSGGNTED